MYVDKSGRSPSPEFAFSERQMKNKKGVMDEEYLFWITKV
jgi:hypothetical protein